VAIGDLVTLEISAKELFYRASQLYMLPLLALFAGGLLGDIIYPEHEAGQIILAILPICLYHSHHWLSNCDTLMND
jgi:sigma-E factor negative regulatory protein RseC